MAEGLENFVRDYILMMMLKRVLLKVSSVLYKTHRYINGLYQEKSSFTPYVLNYTPSDSNTKIIHINGNFIVGGTSQLIVDIIERTSHKYTHKLVVPYSPEPLPYQPVSLHKFSIDDLTSLYDFLQKENPALVHIHYWIRHPNRHESIALWYGAVFRICEELHLNVIQNINVPTQPFKSSAILHNVFVSAFVKDNFNNSNDVSSSVIHPGSNFRHFRNEDINALPDNCIGMVYRLDRDKLNPEAIEVFIRVVQKRPDVKCYIVGGGFYFDYYRKRVDEEQIGENFIFTGTVSYSSLPEYYKKIGVFVTPVHDESFGQVTPFAMSMGLCVAGYDTGALSEILGNKETLVEYGNIEALADVIISLLDNPDKRRKLGSMNRERAVQNFSVEEMISKYEMLYEHYLTSASADGSRTYERQGFS